MNLKATYKGKVVTIVSIFPYDGGIYTATKAAFVDRQGKIRTDLIANFTVIQEERIFQF